MLISIIIPTRNREVYIQQLLKDLKNQSIENYELIVVDQSQDPKPLQDCKHIITKTTGPCISRNLGVQNCKGDILVFLDDDARVQSNFLEEMTWPIITGKASAVAGAMCDKDGNYPKRKKDFLCMVTENFIKAITENPDSNQSQFCLSFPGACCAIKRKVFEEIGGFDENFDPTGAAEDRDIAINLFKNGYTIWYNSQAKLFHIGADAGGSRDVGSRSEGLDINTYKICRKYFSSELAETLKKTILNKYRKRVLNNILQYRGTRSRVQQYFRLRNQLK